MEGIKESFKKKYGHAPAEALFPLFKSDKEYQLIETVLKERFPEIKTNIIVMYKYLASRHLPKFVLFSHEFPDGMVVKRLTPEKAWNEVYFSKILAQLKIYEFDVRYHEELGCISEKYLHGFDVISLPRNYLSQGEYLDQIFYWLGKCAFVAYAFGLGDRGHNERILTEKKETVFEKLSYSERSEPIINIDFEDFPSKRLFVPFIDATEVALLYYSVFIQLSKSFKQDYERFYEHFYQGFKDKFSVFRNHWSVYGKLINTHLRELFEKSPRPNSRQIIKEINQRATKDIHEGILKDTLHIIESELEKQTRRRRENYYRRLKELKKELRSQAPEGND